MAEISIYVLIMSLVAALSMQVYSILKIQEVCRKTKGLIQRQHDLLEVKQVINLNMKLAVLYLVLFGLLIIAVVLHFLQGMAVQGITILFIFGVITLPVGLFGKHFENKIRSMKVTSDDPKITETFQRYLVQWKQARFTLSD
jgi:glucan phosphoethanolaminetransferase (alkaline phosphatase superfamily)